MKKKNNTKRAVLAASENLLSENGKKLKCESYRPEDMGTAMIFDDADMTQAEWIEKHAGLIASACRPWEDSFKNAGYDLEDLMQEASIAVIEAWDAYDSNRCGVLAETYFFRCINNRLTSLFRKTTTIKAGGKDRCYSLDQLSDWIEYSEDDYDEAYKPNISPVFVLDDTPNIDMRLSLEAACKDMEDIEKETIGLYFDGYSRNQISQRLGMTNYKTRKILDGIADSCRAK